MPSFLSACCHTCSMLTVSSPFLRCTCKRVLARIRGYNSAVAMAFENAAPKNAAPAAGVAILLLRDDEFVEEYLLRSFRYIWKRNNVTAGLSESGMAVEKPVNGISARYCSSNQQHADLSKTRAGPPHHISYARLKSHRMMDNCSSPLPSDPWQRSSPLVRPRPRSPSAVEP